MLGDLNQEPRVLVCVVIGKVLSAVCAERVLCETPVYQVDDVDQDKAAAFNCREWVVDPLERLRGSDAVSSVFARGKVERNAVEYVDEKKNMGRWEAGGDGEVGGSDYGLDYGEMCS
jgi:hypothetical protein